MENNNHKKRKVMLIAAFAVAVIALAGVGYAASLNYKATTINDNNDLNAIYVVVDQGSDYTAAFTEDVKFNTYTDKVGSPIYSLQSKTAINGSYGEQVGSTVTMTFNDTGSAATYAISLANVGDLPTGWNFVMKFEGATTVYSTYNGTSWSSVKVAPSTDTIQVSLFITSPTLFEEVPGDYVFKGYTSAQQTALFGDYWGYPAATSEPAYTGVDFIFTIVADDGSA